MNRGAFGETWAFDDLWTFTESRRWSRKPPVFNRGRLTFSLKRQEQTLRKCPRVFNRGIFTSKPACGQPTISGPTGQQIIFTDNYRKTQSLIKAGEYLQKVKSSHD
jgi:hypothetical protein